jgi:outer membrane protein assembly factor BamB
MSPAPEVPTSASPYREPPPSRCFVGTNCHVACLDGRTGALLWQRQLRPAPGISSRLVTLLLEGDRVYASCLGVVSCLRAEDGIEQWRTENRHVGEPSVLALEGPRLVVAGLGHVLAFASDSGALIWQNDLPGISFHPICLRVPGGRIGEPPPPPPPAPPAPPEDEPDDPWV